MKIRFMVVDQASPPSGFDNAKFSKRYTPTVSPFEYPNPYLVIGEDSGDAVDGLTVHTDKNGYASACYYFGNTDNFTYHVTAMVDQVATVDFNIRTCGSPPGALWKPSHMSEEKAVIGSQIELETTGVYYIPLSTPCSATDPCVYDLYPLASAVENKKSGVSPTLTPGIPFLSNKNLSGLEDEFGYREVSCWLDLYRELEFAIQS
jgi:hypothetical protein